MSDPTAARTRVGLRAVALTPAIRAVMEEAARSALLPRFRRLADHEWEEKSAGEIVTVADRECEAMLSEALARLLPGVAVVGEEAAHETPALMERLSDDMCWVVDPLDGTGYFASGEGPFGIMVTLSNRGEAAGGWILDPRGGRFSWAAFGQGCWIDGRRIEGGDYRDVAACGLSPLLKRRPHRLEAVQDRLRTHMALQEIPRCAASHYPAMLLGSPAVTLYDRTLPWDHGPGTLMIEEAGGRAARLDGSPYRLDDDRSGLLVAVDPALWDEVAGLLGDLPE